MRFPYGNAPLALLLVALLAGAGLLMAGWTRPPRPDLVLALFSKEHQHMYTPLVERFEREEGVRVELQLFDNRALQSRLQAAMLAGAEVPDLVEICAPGMGYFCKGPIADVGFVDLTQRIADERIDRLMVPSRFALNSSRGHVFALPHDVHPVGLVYRVDLCEQAGIDPAKLLTWDDFVREGRRIAVDKDGDGVPDRYMIDLPADGDWGVQTLMLQRGDDLFDGAGDVTFDTPSMADLLVWYVHQTRGPQRIGFAAGWGQALNKAMQEGIALFYLAPDWRTYQFQENVPGLAGKLRVMPLPAWTPGGRRTSTWGGTGLAITRASRHQELAWKLAHRLYLQTDGIGDRFLHSNILPPIRTAWTLPEVQRPNPFYGDQRIGALYAGLAPEVPANHVNPYTDLAQAKLNQACIAVGAAFDAGAGDLRAVAGRELKLAADYVRTVMDRNKFMRDAESPATGDQRPASFGQPRTGSP